MSLFKYKAIDKNGMLRRSKLEAESIEELDQQLEKTGFYLIDAKEQKPTRWLFNIKYINSKEIISFTFQMQQLIQSGIPILDAINDLKDSYPQGKMKLIIVSLAKDIESGKTFSQALSRFPLVFDRLYLALIEVAEETGNIDRILRELTESMKWHDEIVSQAKKIFIYPVILMVTIIMVTMFLMVFLVPKIIPFIENMGGVIPVQTQVLIYMGEIISAYWYFVLGLPFIFILLISIFVKNNREARLALDNLKLKNYLVGPLIMKSAMARFSQYFSMMYGAGINVIDALKICEKLLCNSVLEKSFIEVREKIISGDLISNSFKSAGIYPPLLIRMLKLGENTGSLDKALENVSYFYTREVKEYISRLEVSISPVLTLILGLIVLWIMSAVLSPVYEALVKIQM